MTPSTSPKYQDQSIPVLAQEGSSSSSNSDEEGKGSGAAAAPGVSHHFRGHLGMLELQGAAAGGGDDHQHRHVLAREAKRSYNDAVSATRAHDGAVVRGLMQAETAAFLSSPRALEKALHKASLQISRDERNMGSGGSSGGEFGTAATPAMLRAIRQASERRTAAQLAAEQEFQTRTSIGTDPEEYHDDRGVLGGPMSAAAVDDDPVLAMFENDEQEEDGPLPWTGGKLHHVSGLKSPGQRLSPHTRKRWQEVQKRLIGGPAESRPSRSVSEDWVTPKAAKGKGPAAASRSGHRRARTLGSTLGESLSSHVSRAFSPLNGPIFGSDASPAASEAGSGYQHGAPLLMLAEEEEETGEQEELSSPQKLGGVSGNIGLGSPESARATPPTTPQNKTPTGGDAESEDALAGLVSPSPNGKKRYSGTPTTPGSEFGGIDLSPGQFVNTPPKQTF